MKTLIAQSTLKNTKEAVKELKSIFAQTNKDNNTIKAITFYASSQYDTEELISTMNNEFSNINVFGCSTAGEIISGALCSNSIVAMAFTDEVFEDIHIEVVENIRQSIDLRGVITSFNQYFGAKINTFAPNKYFGLVYMDGNSKKEEEFLDELGLYSTLFFSGGSAGDDLKFQKSFVYANEKCYTDAAVIVIVKSKIKFGFEKTQSFVNIDRQVIATKVDEPNRIIYEFDGKPAAEVLSDILNVPKDEVQKYFMKYALGIVIDDEPFIRTMRQKLPDDSIELFCNVMQGTTLTIFKAGDIILDTKKYLDDMRQRYDSISGMLVFSCVARYMDLESNHQTKEYGNLFNFTPTVGFCSYGEAYIGFINHTATILVLE